MYSFKKFIPVILFLPVLVSKTLGQAPKDSLSAVTSDSAAIPSAFVRSIDVYLDYAKLFTLFSDFEKKAEAGASLYLRNHLGLAVEAGYSHLTPQNAYNNAEYHSEGYYGRLGINYLYEYAPGIRLYAGAKYAVSRFSDNGEYFITNPLWQDFTGSWERKDLNANWTELIVGSESAWKGPLYLGFQFRLRIMMNYPHYDQLEVYSIPGYGRTMDKTVPALNLYIKYLIDFR